MSTAEGIAVFAACVGLAALTVALFGKPTPETVFVVYEGTKAVVTVVKMPEPKMAYKLEQPYAGGWHLWCDESLWPIIQAIPGVHGDFKHDALGYAYIGIDPRYDEEEVLTAIKAVCEGK